MNSQKFLAFFPSFPRRITNKNALFISVRVFSFSCVCFLKCENFLCAGEKFRTSISNCHNSQMEANAKLHKQTRPHHHKRHTLQNKFSGVTVEKMPNLHTFYSIHSCIAINQLNCILQAH